MVAKGMSSLIRSGLRASGDRRGRTVFLALSSIAAVIVTMVTIRLALAQTDEGQCPSEAASANSRPVRVYVPCWIGRQATLIAPVGVHHVDLAVSVPVGVEQ